MSLNNFIPEIWSSKLLVRLRNTLVFGQSAIINTDYQGEIQEAGDTVRINQLGQVTVGDYTKNSDMNPPETLTDAQSTLTITQQKYFNFQIDDIDQAQQKPKVMGEAMTEAAFALGNVADQFISGLYTDISSTNQIGSQASPKAPTASAADFYPYLVDLGVLLDNANVPTAGRFVVVPPWAEGLLLKDDRFVKAGTNLTDARLVTGEIGGPTGLPGLIGMVAGFMVFKSNQVPTSGSVYKIIAGHKIGWSFAQTINQVEGYRPEKRFGDAVKGLQLYGAKVVRPEALAVLHATAP